MRRQCSVTNDFVENDKPPPAMFNLSCAEFILRSMKMYLRFLLFHFFLNITGSWESFFIVENRGPFIVPVHDDVIKWKHFPRYLPFFRGIHRSPLNSPPKGKWRGVLIFSLICDWINSWVNNREDGDWRCHRAHYNVILMILNSRVAGATMIFTSLYQNIQFCVADKLTY